jgi:hypothetical protein
MSLNVSGMGEVLGATNPVVLVSQNFQIIEDELFHRQATKVNGVRNTLNGPPTAGDHVLNELWVDQNLANFICTVAGTPGTWVQLAPALVAANPIAPIPDGYLIERTDLHFRRYYYNLGGAAWVGAAWRFKNRVIYQVLNETDSLWYTPLFKNDSNVNTFFPGDAGEA